MLSTSVRDVIELSTGVAVLLELFRGCSLADVRGRLQSEANRLAVIVAVALLCDAVRDVLPLAQAFRLAL